MNEYLSYYNINKTRLNEYIQNFNNELKNDDNKFISDNLQLFADLNSDGKLIRGTLVNLGYKIIQGESDYSMPLALAFEVFQTSILIHDDIIDNDEVRRGKTTIHTHTFKKYYELTKSEKAISLGNNIAICMGDLGLYKAISIIAENYADCANLSHILKYFTDVVIKTIKGEILDIILPFKEEHKLENITLEKDIMEVYRLKTAYYTIIGPLVLGMLLGGADNKKIADIEKIGEKIGIAFQIQDDILGIYGENIGKNVGSDIEEFKTTLLYAYTKKNKKYFNELLMYYGNKFESNGIDKVRNIFTNCGAFDFALNQMNDLFNEALTILNEIKWLNDADKAILKGFIEYLKTRKK